MEIATRTVTEIPVPQRSCPGVPVYLQTTYWWAYIHPLGVRVFEHQWLVNLILWGNYRRLCSAVLDAFRNTPGGRTLQIACAYGNLTTRLAQCIGEAGSLDVIDILPVQLDNLARKLPQDTPVRLHCMDSCALEFPQQHFDRALLFFLLHEQPEEVRIKSLAEAMRVVRPGGTLTIVDYARPGWLNPMRYVMAPVFALLEPFAFDLWKAEITSWLPPDAKFDVVCKRRFFGGLYQMLTLEVK